MHKLTVLVTLLLLNFFSRASEELILTSSIKEVTVFLNRAQVFRNASVNLKPGQHVLAIEGASAQLDPASLQVGGKGTFVILDVAQRVVYRQEEAPKSSPEMLRYERQIKAAQDSVLHLGYALERVQLRRQALSQEKSILLANPLMTGGKGSDTLPNLKSSLIYLRSQLEDIHRAMVEEKRNEEELGKVRISLNERIALLTQYRESLQLSNTPVPKPIQQILVNVFSERGGMAKLDFHYTVQDASWKPAYDIRSSGPDKPIVLTYKALIRQNSGEDWNQVPLTLSTNDPTLRQERPQLPVWYARYFQEIQTLSAKPSVSDNRALSLAGYEDTEEKLQDEVDAMMAADYSSLVQTFSNVEFKIDLPYSIAADNQERMLLIQQSELSATYRHFLVPRLEQDAFIEARVSGWETLNLLPGHANIFYDGTLIGRAHIDPRVFSDTLSLPMGRDRMVFAQRVRKSTPDEKNRMLSQERIRTESWTITVRNTHKNAVHVLVLDQIPVPAESGIAVKLHETQASRYDEIRGMLEWDLLVESGAEQKRSFGYEIRWDKHRKLMIH